MYGCRHDAHTIMSFGVVKLADEVLFYNERSEEGDSSTPPVDHYSTCMKINQMARITLIDLRLMIAYTWVLASNLMHVQQVLRHHPRSKDCAVCGE